MLKGVLKVFSKKHTLVIKIGSNVLANEDGIREDIIANLVHQVNELKKDNHIILVSSGAVSSGKTITELKTKSNNSKNMKQAYSSIGQIKLMNTYYKFFEQDDTLCSQILLTKREFEDTESRENIKNCINTLHENDIIPIINENDATSIEELMYTDNDELAGELALMFESNLIILTNVDGVLDGSDNLIVEVTANNDVEQYIREEKTTFGKGGMNSKIKVGKKLLEKSLVTVIANGNRLDNNGLIDAYEEKIGTVFK